MQRLATNIPITIVGSIGFDDIKSPFGEIRNTLGGATSYAAMAASCLTENIKVISVVGNDFGDNMNIFHKKNIGIEGIKVDGTERTFFWSGEYTQNMNNRTTHITKLNALDKFDPIVPSSYQNTEILMLGNLSPSIQMSVIQQFKTRPKLIILDTINYWIERTLPHLKKVLKKVDVLMINDEEAFMLSNSYNLLETSRQIMMMGPQILIIKKGENGALLFFSDGIYFCPALILEKVVDPTGAGDTFAGGFIGYLANSKIINVETLKMALLYASVMASFCVEEFGLKGVLNIKSEKIQKRLNTLQNMNIL